MFTFVAVHDNSLLKPSTLLDDLLRVAWVEGFKPPWITGHPNSKTKRRTWQEKRFSMGVGKYGILKDWSRRWAGSLLLAASLISGAAAQLPEPPVNSDLAVRLLPMEGNYSNLDPSEIRRHPLPRLLGAFGSQALGIEPFDFFDSTFEGTVVAAIVSKEKGGSSLAEFVRDREERTKWRSVVSELRSLRDDLVEHYGSSEEAYPAELQTYLEEIRYYEPYLSGGVDYSYEVLDSGKAFRIRAIFPQDSRLRALGEAPVFSSDGETLSAEPSLPPVPLNLVIGAKIKDKTQIEKLMTKGFGPQVGGFWRGSPDQGLEMVSTIRGEWILAADNISNLGGFIESLNGDAPGWSQNPAFQTVARNIEADAPFLLFFDTQKLLASMEDEMPMGAVEKKLASLVGPVGYSVVPFEESQFKVEVFSGVNPPPGSELEAFMESARGHNAATSISTANIPWDASNTFAVDYGHTKALVDAMVELFPEAAEQYEMSQDVFAGMLGIDAEAGFNELFSGAAIVSFERIDILANAFESYLEKSKAMRRAYPKAEDQELGGPPAEGQETEPVKSPLSFVPATFAVQVPIEVNRKAILDLLEPQMGAETSKESLFGVDIVTDASGTISYAVDGEWLYLSGGRTDRLMRRMLEASHGRKESLGSLDSWSRFTVGSKGKLLAFGHQKVDAVYSIVKGFILLLGADFRPLAVELGKLRDYHSVVTVRPDGIVIVGEIVQGDGR